MSGDVKLWEKQPDETMVAYQAFARYRDMGEERSIRAVARELGKSSTLMGRWSSAHGWTVRVEAYDLDEAKQARKKKAEKRSKAVDSHMTAATALMGQALVRMRATPLVDKLTGAIVRDQNGDPYMVPAEAQELSAAAVALDKAIKHQRLALGLPTEHTKQDVVLRQTLEQALDTQRAVRAIIEEQLCADCRKRVGAEIGKLARRQEELADEVTA